MYQAFLNNPANYTDPYGTWTCEPGVECIGPSGTYGIVNIWGVQDVDSEDTSQCFVGRTPGQAYGCLVNSFPDDVPDAKKKEWALMLVDRNYPNRQRPSQIESAAQKGVLLAEKPVEMMGETGAVIISTLTPGFADDAAMIRLGLKWKQTGRLGKPLTRNQVKEIADELEARGWTIERGGMRDPRLKEEYLPGPGGGTKGSSYVDITATKDGKTLRINTIDTYADGVKPTKREATNAARIRKQKPGEHLLLIPKPNPKKVKVPQ